ASLTILTDSPHDPERTVRLFYDIHGHLHVSGPCRFGTWGGRPGDGSPCLVTVTNMDGQPFLLTSARVLARDPGEPHPHVEATWQCSGSSCNLSITWRGAVGDKGFTGTLALTSNIPGEPAAEIPIDAAPTSRSVLTPQGR